MAFPSGSPIYPIVFQDNHGVFDKQASPPFTNSFLGKVVFQQFSLGEQEIQEVEAGLEPGTQYWG